MPRAHFGTVLFWWRYGRKWETIEDPTYLAAIPRRYQQVNGLVFQTVWYRPRQAYISLGVSPSMLWVPQVTSPWSWNQRYRRQVSRDEPRIVWHRWVLLVQACVECEGRDKNRKHVVRTRNIKYTPFLSSNLFFPKFLDLSQLQRGSANTCVSFKNFGNVWSQRLRATLIFTCTVYLSECVLVFLLCR